MLQDISEYFLLYYYDDKIINNTHIWTDVSIKYL